MIVIIVPWGTGELTLPSWLPVVGAALLVLLGISFLVAVAAATGRKAPGGRPTDAAWFRDSRREAAHRSASEEGGEAPQ